MLTKRSKPFPLAHDHHFTMPFQPSKPCTLPGRTHQQNHDMHCLCQRSKQQWRSLISITKERLNLMPILLQWVRIYIFSFLYSYRAHLIVSSSRPSEEVCIDSD